MLSRNWDEFHRRMLATTHGSESVYSGLAREDPVESNKGFTPDSARRARAEFLLRRALARIERYVTNASHIVYEVKIVGATSSKTHKVLRPFPRKQGENMLEVIIFGLSEAIENDSGILSDPKFIQCAEQIKEKTRPGDLRPVFQEFLDEVMNIR